MGFISYCSVCGKGFESVKLLPWVSPFTGDDVLICEACKKNPVYESGGSPGFWDAVAQFEGK